MKRTTGIVNWFDVAEGCGAITSDVRGRQYRLSHAEIQGTTYGLMTSGDRVAFDLFLGPHGLTARNVVKLD